MKAFLWDLVFLRVKFKKKKKSLKKFAIIATVIVESWVDLDVFLNWIINKMTKLKFKINTWYRVEGDLIWNVSGLNHDFFFI